MLPSGFCTETTSLALEPASAMWLKMSIGLVVPARQILPEPIIPVPSLASLRIAKLPPSPSEDSRVRPMVKSFFSVHHMS